jgi:hypothetical protein
MKHSKQKYLDPDCGQICLVPSGFGYIKKTGCGLFRRPLSVTLSSILVIGILNM